MQTGASLRGPRLEFLWLYAAEAYAKARLIADSRPSRPASMSKVTA